jgi:hypothetical protein
MVTDGRPPARRRGRAVWATIACVAVWGAAGATTLAAGSGARAGSGAAAATAGGEGSPPASAAPSADASATTTHCLTSGDGFLRAHLGGAIDARIDWPDQGTQCEGESKDAPSAGVRLSFQRAGGADPKLLFVFGLTGVREGRPAKEVGANLTVIVQGTDRIYGTLGDARCTVDSLQQKRLGPSKSYRVEARGFCTQPAHAVRGDGAVLVSTFEFAGLVNYDPAPEPDPKSLIPREMTPVK